MSEFNRTRERDRSVATECLWRETHKAWSAQNGWYTDLDQTSVVASSYDGYTERTSDYVTPGYRKIIRRGGLVMSALDHTVWSRKYSEGYAFITWPENYWSGTLTVSKDTASYFAQRAPVATYLPIGDDDRMRSIALTKAFARVNPNGIMTGELLSDLDQTVGSLKRPFGSSRDLLRRMSKYRKGRLGKTAMSAARATANAWLEYRYGWKPIILDCESIVKEAHRFREDCYRRILVARASERGETTNVTPFENPSPLGGFTVSGTRTDKQSVRVSAGIVYEVADRTTTERLNQIMGTRPSDLLQTVWEVIPYSFVVDWFSNIGDWLQAVTPDPNVSIRDSWCTSVSETTNFITYQWKYDENRSNPQVHLSGSGGNETFTTLNVRRTVHHQLPTTPVWTKATLSTLHAADAMALLLNPIRKGLESFRH